MNLKDALIANKLLGGSGGGSGNLPTPSAANYGDSLVVGKQSGRGEAIVPEQTVVIDAESEFYIAPLQGSLLSQAHEGDAVIAVIDGITYSGHVLDDGPQIVATFGDDEYSFVYDSESEQPNFFWSIYPAEYTVSLYATTASYAYALDPYAGYDIVLGTSDFTADPPCEIIKLSYQDVYNKVVSGKPVIGIVFIHVPYNEDIDGDSENHVYPLTAVSIIGTPDDSALSLRFDLITGRKYLTSGITLAVAEFMCKINPSLEIFDADYSAYGKNIQ